MGTSLSRKRSAARRHSSRVSTQKARWCRRPLRAVGVGGVDQLVRGDRHAQPGARLGAVVELDALVAGGSRACSWAKTRLARTSAASTLMWSRRLTAAPRPDVALGLVLQRRPQVRRAARSARPRSSSSKTWPSGSVQRNAGPWPRSPSLQPTPRPASCDRRDAALERLRAPGAQGQHGRGPSVADSGELQAVALVVAPAAQEDRLPLARLDLHPHDVDEEAQALLARLGVSSSAWLMCAISCSDRSRPLHHAPAGRRARRTARPSCSLARLTALVLLARRARPRGPRRRARARRPPRRRRRGRRCRRAGSSCRRPRPARRARRASSLTAPRMRT